MGIILRCLLGKLTPKVVLKVVCEEFEELKPIALIIGEQNKKEGVGSELFLVRWWGKIKDRFSG